MSRIPTYRWRLAPEGLATRTQLRALGLRPGGQDVAAQLELVQVLRHIPASDGSLSGARMRARRVAKHLKAIASAEKVVAKQAAALYASFEREFESDLRKIGKARAERQPRAPFTFN